MSFCNSIDDDIHIDDQTPKLSQTRTPPPVFFTTTPPSRTPSPPRARSPLCHTAPPPSRTPSPPRARWALCHTTPEPPYDELKRILKTLEDLKMSLEEEKSMSFEEYYSNAGSSYSPERAFYEELQRKNSLYGYTLQISKAKLSSLSEHIRFLSPVTDGERILKASCVSLLEDLQKHVECEIVKNKEDADNFQVLVDTGPNFSVMPTVPPDNFSSYPDFMPIESGRESSCQDSTRLNSIKDEIEQSESYLRSIKDEIEKSKSDLRLNLSRITESESYLRSIQDQIGEKCVQLSRMSGFKN